jgi:oligoribonuclease (3'-5' exoribonuclease)
VNRFLFWTDLETTGLVPDMDTILEAAWTITDENLRMLTPLRSRLCNISPERRNVDHLGHPLLGHPTFKVGDPQDANEGDWGLLSEVVQHMHEQSGLRDALEHAHRDPVASLRLLTTAADLERLIREDLADVGFDRFGDQLVMAGAGVSHFDNRVFAHHLPSLFPLGGHGFYAYWQHDVSVAARVIGENAWNEIKTSARAVSPDGSSIYEGFDGDRFDPETLIGHRAADDVVRALLDGRILRAVNNWEVR